MRVVYLFFSVVLYFVSFHSFSVVQFSNCFYCIIHWISVMLEYRSTSDRQTQAVTKKNLRIKSYGVNGIPLFLPISLKEKLIAVTPAPHVR